MYIGNELHNFARKLWPIDRSLTGDGVRATLKHIQGIIPDLQIHEVPTGTKVFDWTIPKEWRTREAWIKCPNGEKICDFKTNNLHLVGYSTPIRAKLSLSELNSHLYSLPDQPNAIPYVTSYYKERWGFCLTHNQRSKLIDGEYEVNIDVDLFEGSLTYGELIIPGYSSEEVFLSTYICHPSMANNELSGPVVTSYLAKWIGELNRHFTYRIVFIPETIGSITYLSRNIDTMKARTVAGFNISCVGDNRTYSYLPSRKGNTQSDSVALHVLRHVYPDFKRYSWNDRGSDERQYCAPLIDLPIATIMRSKYGEYPEYHTSLDDLETVVTPDGLGGAFEVLKRSIELIERNQYPVVRVMGEPQLSPRGLYSDLSTKGSAGGGIQLMMNFISFCDGEKSLLEIAELCEVPAWELYSLVEKLIEHELISLRERPILAKTIGS